MNPAIWGLGWGGLNVSFLQEKQVDNRMRWVVHGKGTP
jgi:hypothetical protein